ncbi:hypothetical protein DTO217A2_4143 [Paecilomyces variotii]|nr:hypothetical protein DTO217A2_4143 [Paecilomyces variotii]
MSKSPEMRSGISNAMSLKRSFVQGPFPLFIAHTTFRSDVILTVDIPSSVVGTGLFAQVFSYFVDNGVSKEGG